MTTSIKEPQQAHPNDARSENQFRKQVFDEQSDQLYRNLFISVPSSFVCALIVYIALYRIPHTNALHYWFLGVIVISVLRLVHASLYIRDRRGTNTRYYTFLALTTLSAALWGVAGTVLMPPNFHIEQMIVMVVIAGVATGGVQSLQSNLTASLIYICLLIVPLVIWIFSQEDIGYTILGISITLYLLFNVSISLRGYKFLKRTIRLKYQNIDLAKNLAAANKEQVRVNQELIEKENNLRLIHDNAPIGMAIVSLDGEWLNVNNKLCEIVGYNKNELEKLNIRDITYRDDLETDIDSRTKLLSGRLQSYQIEKRYVNKNHQLIWIVTNVSLVRGKNDKPLYYISQIQDINDKKQNETIMSLLSRMNSMLQLCQNSEEAYEIVNQTASGMFPEVSGGLAIFNKLTNQLESVGSWGPFPLLKPVFKPEDCWAFRSGNVYIANDPKQNAACHHFEQVPASMYMCIPLLVQSKVFGMLNFNAAPGHVITSYQQQVINNFSEIVKLSLANIQLREALSDQAIHDPLTKLFNRRYLYDVLPQMLQHVIRAKQELCVCMLDIDFFKRINDTYGHDAGDEVLKQVGLLLKNNLREADVACRFGGEEFVIVLMGSDLTHANAQMERIRVKMEEAKITVENETLPPVTLSAGLAEAPKHGQTVSEILRAADSALYSAKQAGRNRIVNFQSIKIS